MRGSLIERNIHRLHCYSLCYYYCCRGRSFVVVVVVVVVDHFSFEQMKFQKQRKNFQKQYSKEIGESHHFVYDLCLFPEIIEEE